MFSKSCEYGLRAIIFIAQQSLKNELVSISTIAEEIDSPVAFTSKILQQLTRSKIVKSIKGPHGGFVIEEDKLEKTVLSEIVEIFDGNSIYTGCGLGLSKCDATNPCPLHDNFVAIRNDLQTMLRNTTLLNMIDKNNLDFICLKR